MFAGNLGTEYHNYLFIQIICSWNHALSKEDYAYCNYALGQKSIIDHFIVSKNILDVIVDNCVFFDPTNPTTHNVIKLLVDCFDRIVQSVPGNVSSTCAPVCAWDKASDAHLYHYRQVCSWPLRKKILYTSKNFS